MRRESLKESKEAIEEALHGLEGIRMTRRDDPNLTALKDDIRLSVERNGSGLDSIRKSKPRRGGRKA